MTDPEQEGGPPEFSDPFTGEDVEQRVYGTILQTRNPTTANTIAERVECDPKTARKYLRWFARLGIVTEHDGRPTTYERNTSYFEWRRVNELAADHTNEELRAAVREFSTRIHDYEEQYNAGTPGEVDALTVAEGDKHGSIDDVYQDLGEWATLRRDRRLYERARQQQSTINDGERASS